MHGLSLETVRRVEAMFDGAELEAANALLVEQCGNNLPFPRALDARQLERVRFAALKLSGGDLGRLRKAIELAKTDWRDLLVAAGFAENVQSHESWFPGECRAKGGAHRAERSSRAGGRAVVA